MARFRSLKSSCCLQLFVNGHSLDALRAIENLSRLCRDVLPGTYEVPIIDVHDMPNAAEQNRVMWTPTLLKTFPRPQRRVVGDLSDPSVVLAALDLPPTLLSGRSKNALLARYETVAVESPDGLVVLDAEGSVAFANRAARALMEWEEPSATPHSLCVPWLDDDLTSFRLPVSGDRVAECKASVVEWSGRVCQLLSMRDVTQHVDAAERAGVLIDELRKDRDRLVHDATRDPLTRVLNRRGLDEFLRSELTRSRRLGSSLSALLLDCDDFKRINDTHGHSAGDQVLQLVADTVARTLRPLDRVGRVGGDEFLVVLPSTQVAAAAHVGERILHELSKCEVAALGDANFTVSMGACSIPPSASTLDEVVGHGSAALKVAKSHGKQRVSFSHGSASRQEQEHLETQTEKLMRDPSRLRTVQQPIVDLATQDAVGCELLVRGPQGYLEAPRALFDVARNLGLAEQLDVLCLRANLAAARPRPGLMQHVNLLPGTLQHWRELDLLALIEGHCALDGVCVEINADEIVGDPASLAEACNALRHEGVAVALDNVGFGRHALESMILLAPRLIKIRHGLIRNVADDPGRSRELRRLVSAAQGLQLGIVAQGIETAHDRELLLGLGVDGGQGYLWGEPRAQSPRGGA